MELFLKILMVVIIITGTIFGLAAIYAEPEPAYKDGDIIFRTNLSSQAVAVMAATGSKFTNIGVIKYTPQGLAVIETTRKGHKAILFNKWKGKGVLNRYAVYRYRNLEPKRQVAIINNLYSLRNEPYDYFLNFNNKAIYGSELVYNAYLKAGVEIGRPQKIRSLNLDNPFARNLLHIRLPYDPDCKSKTRDECLKLILSREVITPTALANDLNLELIYSNYPF